MKSKESKSFQGGGPESINTAEYLELAIALAEEAGAVMRKNFSLGMHAEWKEDESPLTATDLSINDLVVQGISKKYPEHRIISEEGSKEALSDFIWICDPVDGTTPFSKGIPTFVFSLCLVYKGDVVMAVLYDPMSERLLTAEKGKGAYLNGVQISVAQLSMLSRTYINWGESEIIPNLQNNLTKKGIKIFNLFSHQYSSLLVAVGEFAAAVYAGKHVWDGAAPSLLVQEAGGMATDLDGGPQRYDGTNINGSVITCGGILHEELIASLRKARSTKD
jgi:myo-inositol-1(or 4)-monophosphatase